MDATLIDAPSSTKNKAGARDPEMHQTRKGNQWYFGMKAHIGVDLHSGLVHTVVGTAANVSDVTQAHALLHGDEELVLGDAGYQGVDRREENEKRKVKWFVAMKPGKRRDENSVRFIAGNDVLEMDNNSTLTLSEKKNSAIVQDSASQKEIDLKGNQINRLIVPFGKRSSVVLADGSTVHINSGTEIEFPTTFPGHAREIDVKGEIFIEVVKKENAPFIIHTPNSQITVYGTSFNVSSYLDEKNESIVLVSGFVEVKSENNSIMLKPNEMAQIENGIVARKKVNVSEYISWRNGYMELNKTPLNDVLKKIGRYYNVEFQYGNELNLINETCSGKLFLSENFDNVLDAFSRMTFLTYEKNKDNTINIKKQIK